MRLGRRRPWTWVSSATSSSGAPGGADGLGGEAVALELLALAASQSKPGANEVGAHEEAPGAARVRAGGESGGQGPGEGGARDPWPGVGVDRGGGLWCQARQARKPVDAEALGGLGGRAGSRSARVGRCPGHRVGGLGGTGGGLFGEASGMGGQGIARGDTGQLHGGPSYVGATGRRRLGWSAASEVKKQVVRRTWVLWPGRRRHCAATRAAAPPAGDAAESQRPPGTRNP